MINVPRLPTAVTGPQQTHGCGWNGLRWGGEERSIPFAPLAHRHRPSGSVSLTLSSCAKHFLIGLRVGATGIGVGRIAQILERPPTPSSPPLVMRIDYRVNALITHSCAFIHTHVHSCALMHTQAHSLTPSSLRSREGGGGGGGSYRIVRLGDSLPAATRLCSRTNPSGTAASASRCRLADSATTNIAREAAHSPP